MNSPHGHQFDQSVKFLLVFCSTQYPRQFDMPHDRVGKNNFLTPGYPGAPSPPPPLALEREHSCRVLDSRPRGRGFEPRRRHCVVVLEQARHIYPSLVQPRKTRPCLTERFLMGRKDSNLTNKPT